MRKRVKIVAIAAVLPLAGAATLATASQAGADPKNPRVVVLGSVENCADDTDPLRVDITAAGGLSGSDTSSRVEDRNAYKITFKNVPEGKGVTATATVTCDDSEYSKSFKLKRPAKGTNQTVNLAP